MEKQKVLFYLRRQLKVLEDAKPVAERQAEAGKSYGARAAAEADYAKTEGERDALNAAITFIEESTAAHIG